MNLKEPKLIKRSDKSQPAQNNLFFEIDKYFMSTNNTCIHFGNNGERYSIIKLLTTDEPIPNQVNYEDVFDSISRFYPNNEFLKDFIFFSKHNMDYEIVIIYDLVNWESEENNILVVDFKMYNDVNIGMIKSIKVIKQKEFQKQLVSKFGINRTNKPLIYATTEFEGYLSDVSIPECKRNDITLFPGDIDLITYSSDYKDFDIFEFKKHTSAGGKCTIYSQSYQRYISKDTKKYFGLAKFCKALGKDYFYNIIYSTRPFEENIVKIEKVHLKNNYLNLLDSSIFKFINTSDFISKIKAYTNNDY